MILLALLPGCKKDTGVKFCEGLNTDGDGVNCGRVFSAGSLLVLIGSDDIFGVEKLTVNIYEKKKYNNDIIQKMNLTVRPEDKKANFDVSLYREGDYLIDVLGRDDAPVAKGEVRIVESY